MTAQAQGKYFLMSVIAGMVVFIVYSTLTAPDRRDTGQRISDAVDAFQDRTTGERINAAIKN